MSLPTPGTCGYCGQALSWRDDGGLVCAATGAVCTGLSAAQLAALPGGWPSHSVPAGVLAQWPGVSA